MDYLWTPWRYQYITKSGEPEGCIFCSARETSEDRAALVVHRSSRCYVILNRFPYTSGHLMVVPHEHVSSIAALPDETAVELIRLAQRSETVLRSLYRPEGVNLGMNLGRSAGAGIAGHVHLHIVPRWTGDTNFMSTVGETRVLPEDLETTWLKLSGAFSA